MSARPPKEDINKSCRQVRLGPFATGKAICSVDEINFTIPLEQPRGAQGNARC